MNIKVNLLKPFSDAVGQKELILRVVTANVNSILKKLSVDYPEFKDKVYDEKGEINEYISIFVNDKPFSTLNGIETELKDGDKLLLFFPISGG